MVIGTTCLTIVGPKSRYTWIPNRRTKRGRSRRSWKIISTTKWKREVCNKGRASGEQDAGNGCSAVYIPEYGWDCFSIWVALWLVHSFPKQIVVGLNPSQDGSIFTKYVRILSSPHHRWVSVFIS